MVINISVQYNGGLLPDIILLTLTRGSLPYTLPFTQAFTRAWLYVTIIDINTIILQYYSGYVGGDFGGGITHGN